MNPKEPVAGILMAASFVAAGLLDPLQVSAVHKIQR